MRQHEKKTSSRRFMRLMENLDDPLARGATADVLCHQHENDAFWERLCEVVHGAFLPDGSAQLTFSADELLLLDLGLSPERCSYFSPERKQFFCEYRAQVQRDGMLLLSEYLKGVAAQIQPSEKPYAAAGMTDSLDTLSRYQHSLKKQREILTHRCMSVAQCDRFDEDTQMIESSLCEGIALHLEQTDSMIETSRKSARLASLEIHLKEASKDRHDLMQDMCDPREIEVLNKKIEECCKRITKLRTSIGGPTLRPTSVEGEQAGADVRNRLREELRVLADFSRMNADEAGVLGYSLLLDLSVLPAPEEVHAAIGVQGGLGTGTRVLLIPAVGTGVYDWNQDLILIPTQPTRSIDTCVRDAFKGYRQRRVSKRFMKQV